jgi:hypothetical protein
MAPTRRTLLKSIAGGTVLASLPAAANAADFRAQSAHISSAALPDKERGSGTLFVVLRTSSDDVYSVGQIDLDPDIDGSWSVRMATTRTNFAYREDSCGDGYHRTDEHTAQSLIDAIMETFTAPAPHLVEADPFPEVDAELEAMHNWTPSRHWTRYDALSGYNHTKPWKTVDDLNANGRWELVTDRADIMTRYPEHNAIIECDGRYYLAVIEGESA